MAASMKLAAAPNAPMAILTVLRVKEAVMDFINSTICCARSIAKLRCMSMLIESINRRRVSDSDSKRGTVGLSLS